MRVQTNVVVKATPDRLFAYFGDRFSMEILKRNFGKDLETGVIAIDPEEAVEYVWYASNGYKTKLAMITDEYAVEEASDIMMPVALYFDGDYDVEPYVDDYVAA